MARGKTMADQAGGGSRVGEGRLRVCYPFIGDSVGGAQVSGSLLIRNLDVERFEPVVVVHESGPLMDYLDRRDIDYLHLPLPSPRASGRVGGPQYATSAVRSLSHLYRFIARQSIDIVHVQDTRSATMWLVPTKLARAQFIWHRRSRFGTNRVRDVLIRLADEVICVSDYIDQGRPPSLETHVVHNPFDTRAKTADKFAARQWVREELGLPNESRLVAYVGRIVPRKRPHTFIEIAQKIATASDQEVVFPLIGAVTDDLQRELTLYAASLGIDPVVRFVGARDPIEPWISGVDVIVAPSDIESFGRVLVEAMLCRTPVVAAADGGHLEIITDGEDGMLVPPQNPDAFAYAVRRLLEDEALAGHIVTNGLRRAQRFSIEEHAASIASIYEECSR